MTRKFRPGSQCAQLLLALREGKVLTPLNALGLAGSLRLSERIREIEESGVKIKREWFRVHDYGCHDTVRVMSYRLAPHHHKREA